MPNEHFSDHYSYTFGSIKWTKCNIILKQYVMITLIITHYLCSPRTAIFDSIVPSIVTEFRISVCIYYKTLYDNKTETNGLSIPNDNHQFIGFFMRTRVQRNPCQHPFFSENLLLYIHNMNMNMSAKYTHNKKSNQNILCVYIIQKFVCCNVRQRIKFFFL